MENIIYKLADIKDLDEIIELGNLLADFEITERGKDFWDKETLKNCLEQPDSGLIVCSYYDNNLAGFIIINKNIVFKIASIDYIFVLPKYRSLKIGKELYNMTIEELKKSSIKQLSITIEYNNKSIIDFFECRGFDKTLNMVNLDLKIK